MEYTNIKSYDYRDNRKTDRDWGVSKTVPNMALSIKEILERAIQGRPVPEIKMESQQLKGEVNFDDVNPMDKSIDPLTTAQSLKKELSDLGLKRKDREKARAEEKAAEELQNIIKKEAEKLQKTKEERSDEESTT